MFLKNHTYQFLSMQYLFLYSDARARFPLILSRFKIVYGQHFKILNVL